MRYEKPHLTYDQQADLLLSRGIIGDRATIIRRLGMVSYYRLSGYLEPFWDRAAAKYVHGSKFETIWRRYTFDRRLRVLVIDAVERTEIAIRSWLAYEHSHLKGPFGYADDASALPFLKGEQRDRFFEVLTYDLEHSREDFAEHFRTKYADSHRFMPIWMAAEIMTLGQVLTFYRGSAVSIQQAVAKRLRVHDSIVSSWLLTLNTVRNVCAHHGRLWNRVMGTVPKFPRSQNEWYRPVMVCSDRLFGVLTILKYCLDIIAPQSEWKSRFVNLLNEYPDIPKEKMGFPAEWEKSPLWMKRSTAASASTVAKT